MLEWCTCWFRPDALAWNLPELPAATRLKDRQNRFLGSIIFEFNHRGTTARDLSSSSLASRLTSSPRRNCRSRIVEVDSEQFPSIRGYFTVQVRTLPLPIQGSFWLANEITPHARQLAQVGSIYKLLACSSCFSVALTPSLPLRRMARW